MLLLLWLIFAGFTAVFASKKGRSGLTWFIVALLLSPLVGTLLVLWLPPDYAGLKGRRADV